MKLTPDYRRLLIQNFQAGTTTAVMLIPQSMAYALVAGVQPVYGLYASLLPLVVYALLGKSRELALGPGALDTLLIGVTIGSLSLAQDSEAAIIAAAIAFQVALIQLLFGFLRGGFLINFLSKPVISGFTSAAALTIALSQVKHLLGMEPHNSSRFYTDLWYTLTHLDGVHTPTALFGLGSILFIVLAKRIRKSFPNALAVVILATLLGGLLELNEAQVAILGTIPKGLPDISFTMISIRHFMDLLPNAFAIAAVGYLSTISISRTFADRNRYDISPNRELVALGASNLAASISQGFPVSASFSRSAVHAEAGSTSPYSLLIVAGWILLTLIFLTEYLYFLPKATLSAIIIIAVLGLVDIALVKHLWKAKLSDMWLLIATFFATLLVGIVEGILMGVLASLALFIFRSTRPHTAILGRLGNTRDFRNVENYPEAMTYPGIILLRIDAQFYFGNVTFLKTKLRDLEKQAPFPLKAIIIEACSINQLDSSADSALQDIAKDYRERNIALKFSSVKYPVMKVMQASGLYQEIGADNFFANLDDALRTTVAKMPAKSTSEDEVQG